MNIMADARHATLKVQAQDAAKGHLQMQADLTPAQLTQITDFERRIYAAQELRDGAGSLDDPDGPPTHSARAIWRAGDAGVLGNNTTRFVFPAGHGLGARHSRRTWRPCAPPSSAATTCTCSAPSGSATPCT